MNNAGRIVLVVLAGMLSGCAVFSHSTTCTYNQRANVEAETFPVKLHRGINLSRWWEDDPSRAPTQGEIHDLRGLGFDFVRVPVSPSWFSGDPNDRAKHLQNLRCDIISLLNEDLKVVIDLHPADEEEMTSAQIAAQIENFWRTIQPAYTGLPPQRVLLSLYNEPQMDTDAWWRMQQDLLKKLRMFNPRHTFVVTTSPAAGWWELEWLKPYKDPNLIYDVHFYEPMVFTHHGAEWLGKSASADAIVYPSDRMNAANISDPEIKKYAADTWNQTAITQMIKRIATWEQTNHVEVAVLEFGVYRPYVDDQSRLGWLRDVRAAIEGQGLPWALWEYRGPFGLIYRGEPDESMANALGLGHTAAP